jgi:hypothetical protein
MVERANPLGIWVSPAVGMANLVGKRVSGVVEATLAVALPRYSAVAMIFGHAV